MSEVTPLLQAVGQGDLAARAKLLPLVYEELRRIARAHMSHERAEHTLGPTALVHEAYLRLFGEDRVRFDGRGHFFSAAAEAMRRILIEHARRKQTLKNGGGWNRVECHDDLPSIELPCASIDELLSLDDALERLIAVAPEQAELVKLLYFAGLNLDGAAQVLGISRTTAYRRWQFARAWLYRSMTGEERRS